MKSVLWIACMCLASSAFSTCDLHNFRWSCDLPAAKKPISSQNYTVYCANLPVYVTREVYLEVMRYQHANVNMDLTVDGEYVLGPCIPGSLANIYASTTFTKEPLSSRPFLTGVYK